jgi:hypothetical protein
MLGYGFALSENHVPRGLGIDSVGDGFIWAYEAHEGFWGRVARRAGR